MKTIRLLLWIGLASISGGARETNVLDPKAVLLKHLPKEVGESNMPEDWRSIVTNWSTFEVGENFIPGFAVLRMFEKPNRDHRFHGAFLYNRNRDELIDLRVSADENPASVQKAWFVGDQTAFNLIYLYVRNQSGFGKYRIGLNHLSKKAHQKPTLIELPYGGFLAQGNLGEFKMEEASSTLVYRQGERTIRLFKFVVAEPSSVSVLVLPDARKLMTGPYTVNLSSIENHRPDK